MPPTIVRPSAILKSTFFKVSHFNDKNVKVDKIKSIVIFTLFATTLHPLKNSLFFKKQKVMTLNLKMNN